MAILTSLPTSTSFPACLRRCKRTPSPVGPGRVRLFSRALQHLYQVKGNCINAGSRVHDLPMVVCVPSATNEQVLNATVVWCDLRLFYFSAAIPLRISSLILAARLPSDPSIAAMMSASVRRLSLAVINKVFSRIQAFLASLSAIDFYPLLCYSFNTASGEG